MKAQPQGSKDVTERMTCLFQTKLKRIIVQVDEWPKNIRPQKDFRRLENNEAEVRTSWYLSGTLISPGKP